MKALLFDRWALTRERVRQQLQELPGIDEVMETDHLPRAVQLLTEQRPEAVVVCLHGPGGDALRLFQALRRAGMPRFVIALNALADPSFEQQVRELGATQVLDISGDLSQLRLVPPTDPESNQPKASMPG